MRTQFGALRAGLVVATTLSISAFVTEAHAYTAEEQQACMGDAFRLSQVVDNLVSNALKYSPEEAEVMVTLDEPQVRHDGETHRTARLRVADKGVGIPSEDIPHIFERFYRAAGVDVQAGAGVGLGLGLHITHSIVERHGGEIEVRSTPGNGSTFEVRLPLLDARDAEGV